MWLISKLESLFEFEQNNFLLEKGQPRWSDTAAMNAFLRGVLGKKSSQDIPAVIPIAVNEQTTRDDEEEDEDTTSGFKKDNLRNSRFYRSMRKKRLPPSESSQSK